MIGWIAVRYDFDDKWLAEAWVELSSQKMILTDDQCKNTRPLQVIHTQQSEARRVLQLLSRNSRGRPTRDKAKQQAY